MDLISIIFGSVKIVLNKIFFKNYQYFEMMFIDVYLNTFILNFVLFYLQYNLKKILFFK